MNSQISVPLSIKRKSLSQTFFFLSHIPFYMKINVTVKAATPVCIIFLSAGIIPTGRCLPRELQSKESQAENIQMGNLPAGITG